MVFSCESGNKVIGSTNIVAEYFATLNKLKDPVDQSVILPSKGFQDWNPIFAGAKAEIVILCKEQVKLVHSYNRINGKNYRQLVTYRSGAKYTGECDEKSDPNGHGLIVFPNGDRSIGMFKANRLNGFSVKIFIDGRMYFGEYLNGQRNGHGTFKWPDGMKYTGEWRDDVREGNGSQSWPSGQTYIGEYLNGKRNGNGTLTWPDGSKYIGKFKDD